MRKDLIILVQLMTVRKATDREDEWRRITCLDERASRGAAGRGSRGPDPPPTEPEAIHEIRANPARNVPGVEGGGTFRR